MDQIKVPQFAVTHLQCRIQQHTENGNVRLIVRVYFSKIFNLVKVWI